MTLSIRSFVLWTVCALIAAGVVAMAARATAQVCPPGYYWTRWRTCAPVPCPPGYVRNRIGQCARPVVAPVGCPPGYFYYGGRCVMR